MAVVEGALGLRPAIASSPAETTPPWELLCDHFEKALTLDREAVASHGRRFSWEHCPHQFLSSLVPARAEQGVLNFSPFPGNLVKGP
jgi:hypothetical protein